MTNGHKLHASSPPSSSFFFPLSLSFILLSLNSPSLKAIIISAHRPLLKNRFCKRFSYSSSSSLSRRRRKKERKKKKKARRKKRKKKNRSFKSSTPIHFCNKDFLSLAQMYLSICPISRAFFLSTTLPLFSLLYPFIFLSLAKKFSYRPFATGFFCIKALQVIPVCKLIFNIKQFVKSLKQKS